MHIAIQKIIRFKAELKLEYLYNILIVFIITIILFLASFALYRPISVLQFKNIIHLSTQASYPHTQVIALMLVQQHKVSHVQYFKLMQAYQWELKQAHQLSPFQADKK